MHVIKNSFFCVWWSSSLLISRFYLRKDNKVFCPHMDLQVERRCQNAEKDFKQTVSHSEGYIVICRTLTDPWGRPQSTHNDNMPHSPPSCGGIIAAFSLLSSAGRPGSRNSVRSFKKQQLNLSQVSAICTSLATIVDRFCSNDSESGSLLSMPGQIRFYITRWFPLVRALRMFNVFFLYLKVRPCWPRPWPTRPRRPSCGWWGPSSSRSTWVTGPSLSESCSGWRRSTRPPSCSSTRLTPSAPRGTSGYFQPQKWETGDI